MLNGIDISHHNFNMQSLNDLNVLDFVILKATEGVRFRDPKMRTYLKFLRPDMLYGFYHYARPELGNDPEEEAQHFVNFIKPFISDRSILALDVEDAALNVKDLDAWCAVWVQCVDVLTGVLPMLYCSTTETKRFPATAALGCGLWAAKWGNKPTKKQIEPWPFYAIWQHTNECPFSGIRVDADQFNGEREQWLKYCKVD